MAAFAIALLATSAGNSVPISAGAQSVSASTVPISVPKIAVTLTTSDLILSSGVTVYKGAPEIKAVTEEFPKLWEEGGFAKLLEEE